MKLTLPTFRIAAGLGLAAGLMIGCQDLLNPGKTANDPAATGDETGSLSLSIRNDSTCRGEWQAILDARTAGHPDSASEAAFLASCVIEVKPGKDEPKPVVPPALRPDSGIRCKWIVSQIEGGRDSLTVSYQKYCPDDCRKLEIADSASHEKLCREPKPGPVFPPRHAGDDSDSHKGPGDDSLPPKPHGDDSLPPKPHGDDSLPPKPPVPDDTCKMLHEKLEVVKPGEAGRAELEHLFALRCKEPVPRDSMLPPPPPKDTGAPKLPPPPKPAPDSICLELKLRLASTAPGDSGRSELEAAFKAKCMEAIPVPPPTLNCDELRKKLALLDPASVDYAHLASTLKEHCPEILPAK